MTILKNIITTIIGTVLIILLPFVIFTYVTSKSDVFFDFRSYTVLTGSMEPVLPVGSMIYTQPKPTYEIGDIVTFTDKDKRTVTHRIAEKSEKAGKTIYATRGDANNAEDKDVISQDKIVGSVFFHVPYIGKYMDFLKRPQNFLAIVVLPALILIGFEFWNIKNEIVKETEKKVLKRLEENKT